MSSCINFICRIVAIGIVLLGLLSCVPQPNVVDVPQIQSVSAEVTGNTCELTAEVSDVLHPGYLAGFMYGKSEDDMQRVAAQSQESVFRSKLSSLDYDTEYLYKAYVSNGRNEVCSDIGYFRTHKKNDDTGDDSDENDKSGILLPFNDITVGSMETVFSVEVGGDGDFFVDVPPEAYWILCERKGRVCEFFVFDNSDLSSRTCEIIFCNVKDMQCETLTIYQSAVSMTESNLPFNFKQVSSYETSFRMFLREDLFRNIRWLYDGNDGNKWISLGSITEGEYIKLIFDVAENTALEERMARLIITYDGFDSVLTIVQEGWDGVVRFKDPLVRDVCVEAFDIDHDNELTYDEIRQIPSDGFDDLDFSHMNVISFDEFQFFSSVTGINNPVFAGSKLQHIRFPDSLTILDNGVFKGCTELMDNMFLLSVYIGDEVFMGCARVANVQSKIIGIRAFENCTALESAMQLVSGIPSYSFKNCRALRNFEHVPFEEYVHYIGEEAFMHCVSLPEMIVAEDINEIRSRAFYGCSSLMTVRMNPLDPPALGEEVFTGTSPDLKIYVQPESLSRYKAAWPSLADRIAVQEL